MDIILREDVDKLGKRGAAVSVKDGYARNFLLPRRLAVAASEANLRQVEAEERQRAAREARERQAAEEMAQRFVAESVTVTAKTGPDHKLFGSVTAEDIARALTQAGFAVTKRQVHLDAPIKELGVYEVPLRVHREVPVTARVRVVKA